MGARVEQGVIVLGPDGHRDIDVRVITRPTDGQHRRVLVVVECKDYDPGKTGPVGIAYLDALESKARDLSADVAFICSNAGFTSDAINKAKRVGIRLIGAMRNSDGRIRFKVTEDLYTRRITVTRMELALRVRDDAVPLAHVPFDSITFAGLPVGNWVRKRAMCLLKHPIVSGNFELTYRLTEELQFQVPSSSVVADWIGIKVALTGGWFAQQAQIDSTGAVYDWLRRRVRMLPGPGQLSLVGVNMEAGRPVDGPPPPELSALTDLQLGEAWMQLSMVSGIGQLDPAPDLDKFVHPDDLNDTIPPAQPV